MSGKETTTATPLASGLGTPVPELIDQALLARIESLDLDCIKVRLMRALGGKGWSREKADVVERNYRRFLYMCATENALTIPSNDVDEFWHAHILDTEKYASDCEQAIGRFVHHFPYIGMRSDEDQQVLQECFQATKNRYRQLFGDDSPESLETSPADCSDGSCGAGSCGPRSHLEALTADGAIDVTGRPTLIAR